MPRHADVYAEQLIALFHARCFYARFLPAYATQLDMWLRRFFADHPLFTSILMRLHGCCCRRCHFAILRHDAADACQDSFAAMPADAELPPCRLPYHAATASCRRCVIMLLPAATQRIDVYARLRASCAQRSNCLPLLCVYFSTMRYATAATLPSYATMPIALCRALPCY